MYAYYHHIGDYRKDTAHLSLVEHGIYRQLLDTYYLDERPLTLDHAKLMRSHSVRSADEVQAFENVLQDFFVRTEEGYVHKRCESEIAQFKAKSDSASKSAKARWAKQRSGGNADAMRSHTEGNANQQPVTDNHNPSPAVKGMRGSRLPNDWKPTDEDVLFCKTERPDLDCEQVAAEFRDYWTAKTGKDATKTQWDATWRNWVRRQRQAMVLQKAKVTTLWTLTPQAMSAKARELGISDARPGESVDQFKARIIEAINASEAA